MGVCDIKSDTLTLLICNQFHKHLTDKQRAIKIAKCCKVVRDRTKDQTLYNACRSVIKAVGEGRYAKVIEALKLTENNYFYEYGKELKQ